MKSVVSVGLAVVLAAGITAARAAEEDAAAGKGMAFVRVGEVPRDVFERVREFVELNTAIRVRVREDVPDAGESLQEIGRVLEARLEPEDEFLIALVWPESEQEEHARYLYDENVAVVNVRALEHAEDPEVYGRRVEKVAMRSVGVLLGVDPVPNPQSAMYPYRTMEELDAMGRNYDPPSLMNVQRAAVERGIDLVDDSPYIIINR